MRAPYGTIVIINLIKTIKLALSARFLLFTGFKKKKNVSIGDGGSTMLLESSSNRVQGTKNIKKYEQIFINA